MTHFCHLSGRSSFQDERDGTADLRVVAEAKLDHAGCSTCRTDGRSIHSRYQRQPVDTATSGHEVRLVLTVRRFCCHDPAYARRTLAARLPRLLDRHAQGTYRSAVAPVRTALALGATPAARLLPHLAMPTSAPP
jgi:transposase